jgi:ABC-type transport system involved in cytochrome c biogenesis ATPase subunit
MTTQPVQAIRVQGLEKSYPKVRVLRGVDFDVARGSIFALLGSNGAGKTTVVKILSTLLKPDAGTATVDGFDVAAQPANVRESISLTGQFAAVDENLTGRENLVLVARLRHLKGAGQIADGLLERFSLADAAGRRAAAYSGGMRRRLDIFLPFISSAFVPTRTMPGLVRAFADNQPVTSIVKYHPRPVHPAARHHRHLDRPRLVPRHSGRRLRPRHDHLPPQDRLSGGVTYHVEKLREFYHLQHHVRLCRSAGASQILGADYRAASDRGASAGIPGFRRRRQPTAALLRQGSRGKDRQEPRTP